MFMKMNNLVIGFGFFGDPLIWRGLDWLNKTYPNWQKLLELRKYVHQLSITNIKLTLIALYSRVSQQMLS